MIGIFLRQLSVLTFFVALAGCGSTASKKAEPSAPAVRQVTQSAHCGLTGPGLVWIENDQQLEKLLDVTGQNMATGMLRKVDLSRERLVFVTLGQRSTAGYSVGLDEFSVNQKTLILRMRVREPAPGKVVAQITTSPCVVLAVSPLDWQRLEVAGVTGQPLVRSLSR